MKTKLFIKRIPLAAHDTQVVDLDIEEIFESIPANYWYNRDSVKYHISGGFLHISFEISEKTERKKDEQDF